MAELSPVGGDVDIKTSSASHLKSYVAGETVDRGEGVYQKVSDSKYYLSSCDVGAEEANLVGVCVDGGDADEDILVQVDGIFNIGATTVKGEIYVPGTTRGAFMPIGDLASTNYVTLAFIAQDTAGNCDLKILQATGYQK